jgi:hypothetical protein
MKLDKRMGAFCARRSSDSSAARPSEPRTVRLGCSPGLSRGARAQPNEQPEMPSIRAVRAMQRALLKSDAALLCPAQARCRTDLQAPAL